MATKAAGSGTKDKPWKLKTAERQLQVSDVQG